MPPLKRDYEEFLDTYRDTASPEVKKIRQAVFELPKGNKLSVEDAKDLRAKITNALNNGIPVDDLLLQLEEELKAKERQNLANEVVLLAAKEGYTPTEKAGLQVIHAVIAGDKAAVDAAIDAPDFNPNAIFGRNIPIYNSNNQILPIQTRGKAFLHLLPSIVGHGSLSEAELPEIVNRVVQEKGANINLESITEQGPGMTPLEYAVTEQGGISSKLKTIIDAFIKNGAEIREDTVNIIKEKQNIEAAEQIILSRKEMAFANDNNAFEQLKSWIATALAQKDTLVKRYRPEGPQSRNFAVEGPKTPYEFAEKNFVSIVVGGGR